ncbi:MAG: DNA polymerase III subunit alpha, partial [Planctomycetota bacterium]|nr:DNA polymerase III subunit alpha [Planctomycetota bacterium]
LVESAIAMQQGLIFLADHPRLLLGLFGHIPAEQLFAAISPASLRLDGSARRSRLVPRPKPHAPRDVSDELGRDFQHSISGSDAREAPGAPTPSEPPAKCPAPAQPLPASSLVEAARAVGVATLAVPDVYYGLPGGTRTHRIRVAVKHNALVDDLDPTWLAPEPAHLPTHSEMCALYADLPEVPGPWVSPEEADPAAALSTVPGAVARTLWVAERCRFTPVLDQVNFPSVKLGAEETPYSKLCEWSLEGAQTRYRPLRPEVLRRLDVELSTIDQLGYAPYFLLVQRIAEYARDQGIPCVGRGSAASSLVAYCLGLTEADPFRYGLPFERFLNPQRRDRPDIDLDFCWRRRDEVLEHVYDLFGAERTAMICTLNRFGPRSALREAALVHGVPPAQIQPWAQRLPHTFARGTAESSPRDAGSKKKGTRTRHHEPSAASGGCPPIEGGGGGGYPPALADNPLAQALRELPAPSPDKAFPFQDERFRRVLEDAAELLDAPRHFGLHPGGVVVAPGPLAQWTACQRAAKPHPTRGNVIVTQLDKDAVEAMGLVKMDLLGNRALTTLADCLAILGQEGIQVDFETLAEDDALTAELLRTGRTVGCFQIESPGMRNLLQQMQAHCMDDVIRAVALIRPGPAGSGMKDSYVRRARGLEPATPLHPRLAEVLQDTHGVMLYQEDVMQAAAHMAGMGLAQADQLRRALQKHRSADIASLRAHFLQGCTEQGVLSADAIRVWEQIAGFASFAFCKSHAVTYGRIAYRTAWLKAHYPAAFLIAFLASETGYYPRWVYVEEARRLGVPILGPDVNRSASTFSAERLADQDTTPASLALRVGLAQVHGLSSHTLDRLLQSRQQGPFLSLPDLLERSGAHRHEVDALIQCGALDAFDRTRPELLWRLHLLHTPQRRAASKSGLNLEQLQACQRTPADHTREALDAARAHTSGWAGRGLGVEHSALPRGQSALLFPTPPAQALVLPGLPDEPALTRARTEFDLLGLSPHAHPVRLFPCPADERLRTRVRHGPRDQRPVNPVACAQLNQWHKARVTLRGWPAATRSLRTQTGQLMQFLTLEDESGLAEVVLFPEIHRRDSHLLSEQGVLCITGVVEDHLGAYTLQAERIW